MNNRNNTTFQAHEQKALVGVDKHFSTVSSLTIGGVQYTPADLKKILTDDLGARQAVGAQRAALSVVVKAATPARAKANALLKALRVHIVDQYGANAAPILEDFGYPPPRVGTKPTVKDLTQKVAKQLATREARKTMGRKQRKQVKGATPETKAGGAAGASSSASK
jgi:hypothetical protein